MDEKEYEEVSKDWTMDFVRDRGVHESGLEMAYVKDHDSHRVQIKGRQDWLEKEHINPETGEKLTAEQVEEKFIEIGRQFVKIILYHKNQQKNNARPQNPGLVSKGGAER